MFKKFFFILLLLGVASTGFCEGVVTLPDTGIDFVGYITSGIIILGGFAGTAVGGYASFLIVRKALRWVSISLSSDSDIELELDNFRIQDEVRTIRLKEGISDEQQSAFNDWFDNESSSISYDEFYDNSSLSSKNRS